MKLDKYFIIDFDSTFTKVEAFDVLAEICLSDNPERELIKKQITEITNQGMDGSLSLRESIDKRIKLLSPHKKHLSFLVDRLRSLVTDSFQRNKDFFNKNAEH